MCPKLNTQSVELRWHNMKFNEINRKVNIGKTMSWFDGYALHKQNALDIYSKQKHCTKSLQTNNFC